MKNYFILSSIAFGMLFAGCESSDPDGPSPGNTPNVRQDIYLSAETRAVVDDYSDFTTKLFKEVASEQEKNWAFSPWSVAAGLSMVANATQGEAQEEILNVVMNNSSLKDANALNHTLTSELLKADQSCTLKIANAFWCTYDLAKVDQTFLQTMQNDYACNISRFDWTNLDKLKNDLNQWIAEATDGMITEGKKVFSSNIRFLFNNTFYFKGAWRDKFSPANTKSLAFVSEDVGEVLYVPTMKSNSSIKLKYGENEACSYVGVPYGNGAFEFVAFVPQDYKTTSNVVDWLSVTPLKNVFAEDSYISNEMELELPKFILPNTTRLFLDKFLYNLGIKKIFNAKKNLFPMISDDELGMENIEQCIALEVNEEGTTAAVSTTFSGDNTAPGPPAVFKVNKSFIFMIRETSTGVVLLMGRMSDPRTI